LSLPSKGGTTNFQSAVVVGFTQELEEEEEEEETKIPPLTCNCCYYIISKTNHVVPSSDVQVSQSSSVIRKTKYITKINVYYEAYNFDVSVYFEVNSAEQVSNSAVETFMHRSIVVASSVSMEKDLMTHVTIHFEF
jgi:hypothetical protein